MELLGQQIWRHHALQGPQKHAVTLFVFTYMGFVACGFPDMMCHDDQPPPATGVSRALRARSVSRSVPGVWGCLRECLTEFAPRALEYPKSVPRVCLECREGVPDTPGHSRGTFWTLRSPQPEVPRRHSVAHSRRHPGFQGHPRRHFGPEGPERPLQQARGVARHVDMSTNPKTTLPTPPKRTHCETMPKKFMKNRNIPLTV